MSLLLTPGPLTTSPLVKQYSMVDMGSRDDKFINIISNIRQRLWELSDVNDSKYDTILMQGCGTMGIEAVLNSIHHPQHDKVLIVENGVYGERMAKICQRSRIPYDVLKYDYVDPIRVVDVFDKLEQDKKITSLALVHSETTTGLLNPVEDIGKMLADRYPHINYIVDAMSSFGGVPLDIKGSNINYMISSSNKCIQGIAGFSFIIANTQHLIEKGNNAQTLSLDIKDQWEYMRKTNQFRFTPPVQSLIGFEQALMELEMEGGIQARNNRYRENQMELSRGMCEIGFKTLLPQNKFQGPIITTFKEPNGFKFDQFYKRLKSQGFTIYNGKLHINTFRVGSIGHVFKKDMIRFNNAVKKTHLKFY